MMTADATSGLCATCLHARVVRSGRGSTFLLCDRSKNDPRFARYPRLPVLRCSGFERISGRTSPASPGA